MSLPTTVSGRSRDITAWNRGRGDPGGLPEGALLLVLEVQAEVVKARCPLCRTPRAYPSPGHPEGGRVLDRPELWAAPALSFRRHREREPSRSRSHQAEPLGLPCPRAMGSAGWGRGLALLVGCCGPGPRTDQARDSHSQSQPPPFQTCPGLGQAHGSLPVGWGTVTQPHRLVVYKQHHCIAHRSGGWKLDQGPAGSGHRYLVPPPARQKGPGCCLELLI